MEDVTLKVTLTVRKADGRVRELGHQFYTKRE